MKKNKFFKFIATLILSITLLNIIPSISAKADTYYAVQKIKTYYSYNECKKIVQNYKTTSKISTISAALTGKNPFISAALVAYGYSMTDAAEFFQKAVNKRTGVEISYDYYLSNTSHSMNVAKNTKITYK